MTDSTTIANGSAVVGALLEDELRALRLQAAGGGRAQAVKALDERGIAQELVRQQYYGRYPFELLQNANDASGDVAGARRVRFVLTETALVIANMGRGFGESEVRAVAGLGRSSKDPRKSIGYKGLGFKAIGEITDRPQIFSPPHCFGFDAVRARELVHETLGKSEGEDRMRLPVYAFPFPLGPEAAGPDAEVVADCLANGFVTVIRLPLRPSSSRETVAGHLVSVLRPDLLLLLDRVDGLELTGTSGDFTAERVVSDRGTHLAVTLTVDSSRKEWLVFRETHEIDDPGLVTGIGEGWGGVKSVGTTVAIPLGAGGRPDVGRARPLHVYFPLEDTAGTPALLHADFMVELDRRHLSQVDEVRPYNEWLLARLAEHVGSVARQLAATFPGHPATLDVFAPCEHVEGEGGWVREHLDRELQSVEFVPCQDSLLRVPEHVRLLPETLAGISLPAIFDLRRAADLAQVAPRETPTRAWLKRLGAKVAEDSSVLEYVKKPPRGNTEDFYAQLIAWHDAIRFATSFERALAKTRCLYTTNGRWVAPAADVYFPRRHDDPELPADLAVAIAEFPQLDRLESLMHEAGVLRFSWRDLLSGHILPLLTAEDTSRKRRAAAFGVLRTYHRTTPAADTSLALSSVLIPAHAAGREGPTSLKPANEVYFSAAWSGNDNLELLYGPFGLAEFLAEVTPPEEDEMEQEKEFFRWLGVAELPRLIESRTSHQFSHLRHHRHAGMVGKAWQDWLSSLEVVKARECGQRHPDSQHLRGSVIVDRLTELLDNSDPARLVILTKFMADHFEHHFERAMHVTIECRNTTHRGDGRRPAASVTQWLLRTRSWLPATAERSLVLRRPNEVWRTTKRMNRQVSGWLPVLFDDFAPDRRPALWDFLQVADPRNPQAGDLVRVLRRLAAELEVDPGESAAVQTRGQWAMRTLNDALVAGRTSGWPTAPDAVPLLAVRGTTVSFVSRPYVVQDEQAADVWRDDVHVLIGGRDLRVLTTRLGLQLLDEAVTTQPRATVSDLSASGHLHRQIEAVASYLLAVVQATAPTSSESVSARLRNLEVVACASLTLEHRFGELSREQLDAQTFVGARLESLGGAAQRLVGTAYVVCGPDTEPDWFSLARQLAAFLGVPQLEDAFALLLISPRANRLAFLKARKIDTAALEAAQLALHVADEEPELLYDFQDALAASAEPAGEIPQSAGEPMAVSGGGRPTANGTVTASSGHRSPVWPSPRPTPALPPLSDDIVEIETGPDTAVTVPSSTGVTPSSGSGGPVDWEATQRRQREAGERGEEWAYRQERARVAASGHDPDEYVVWQSRKQPTSNFDIRSIDEDGHVIYIEVKATQGKDITEPIEISSGELAMAIKYRSRYLVYRVLDVGSRKPQIFQFRDPVGRLLSGASALKVTSAKIHLAGDS